MSAADYPAAPDTTLTPADSGSTSEAGDLIPEASPISSIKLWCNICDSSFFSNSNDNILAEFSPQTASGEQYELSPNHLVWYETTSNTVSNITCQFLDQENRPLAIRDNSGMSINLLVDVEE